jgi:L-galactose dehydrogenase
VEEAFTLGINLFDTSPFYGGTKSEAVRWDGCGEGEQAKRQEVACAYVWLSPLLTPLHIHEMQTKQHTHTHKKQVLGRALGRLPRDQIVVATKVGRYGPDTFDFSAEATTASVSASTARLGVDRLDLVQCHDIEFGDLREVVTGALPALAALKEKGVVGAVGVTGLPLATLKKVVELCVPLFFVLFSSFCFLFWDVPHPHMHTHDNASHHTSAPAGLIDVVLSYCHCCPADHALDAAIPWFTGRGLGVISASPLSMGLLTPQGPPPWHPAPAPLKAAAAQAVQAATALGVDVPALALRDALTGGGPAAAGISTHLVGLCTRAQVRAAVGAAAAALAGPPVGAEAEALDRVRAILAPVVGMTWPSGRPENS